MKEALAKRPATDRAAWQKPWAEIDAPRKEAGEAKEPGAGGRSASDQAGAAGMVKAS